MHVLSSSLRSALVRAIALSALLIVAVPSRSPAAGIYFTNASGSWNLNAASSWTPAGVPGLNDTAFFTSAVVQTYTQGGNWATANVNVDGGGGGNAKKFDLGNGLVWTVTNEFLINNSSTVGHTLTSGTLAITNGAQTGTLHVGTAGRFYLEGGILLADQIQVDSTVNNRFRLNSGTLELTSGKTNVINARIQLGGATIQGSNTILKADEVYGDNAPVGQMVIKDKASVISAGLWGVYKDGQKVLVTDGGQMWGNASVYLGRGASTAPQTLVVSNGGRLYVKTTFATGGDQANGFGANSTFTGTGTWVGVGGEVQVGRAARYSTNASSILVTDGAVMEFQSGSSLTLGEMAGFTNSGGILRFVGANPSISKAYTSTAKVEMVNGTIEFQGLANANLTGALATMVNYSGANTLSLTNAKNADVTTYTIGSGQSFAALDLKDSASAFESRQWFLIETGGTLKGSGTMIAGTVTNKGTLAPGHSPGTLTFSNNLVLDATSLLVLEIAGTNASAYDRLVGGGTLTAGGTLTVTNLGWTFAAGDAFDLLDFAAFSGNFDTMSLPTLSGGLLWDTSLFGTQGLLSVMAVPEPTALMAMGAGLAFLLFLRRRREG